MCAGRVVCLRMAAWLTCLAIGGSCSASAARQGIDVPNGGFERLDGGRTLPNDWQVGIGGGADGSVLADETVRHSGARSIRLTNRSPLRPFVYVMVSSSSVAVQPDTTYVVRFFVRGVQVRGCYVGIRFENGAERRQNLPAGDFDWQEARCVVTTPQSGKTATIWFASDDVTSALWVDDVTVSVAAVQRAKLREKRWPKSFEGVWPRSHGPVARRLVVYDCARDSDEAEIMASALQGIVNRSTPRLYLLHRTNPPDQDRVWLQYMQRKSFTGPEERVVDLRQLVARFRKEIRGAIVYDPALSGTMNAACMAAGMENALPASAGLASSLGLPAAMDLRGRWKRNVDAYRWAYGRYWPRMCHHVLAWVQPLSGRGCFRDYTVQHNVFSFWISSPGDHENGADPAAEEAFVEELLANTPANIPVMGWPAWGDSKGVSEYAGVRWLSEYGKFVPGTEFCSNLSVHSAIRPADRLLRAKPGSRPEVPLQRDKVYLSVNVMDSGDALWYWQFHQRKIWQDKVRGSVPIGWCMNTTLVDMLPLVLQWYVENATPNDTFFAAVSGLGYMNTQTYASRFREPDRGRIWRDYVRLADSYRRRLGLDGIELYNGGWGEKTPPAGHVFEMFAGGMKGLSYILADLGRHETVRPSRASYLLGRTAVFHTLTRFRLWAQSSEVASARKDESNAWLLKEIEANTPKGRPGFMSAMAISWYYYPAWFKDLKEKLPSHYVLVSPGELARLYRRYARGAAAHSE